MTKLDTADVFQPALNAGAFTGGNVIEADSFGARYASFRAFERFEEQIEDSSFGLIHWPGGALAEKNDGRFGFENDGLLSPDVKVNMPDIRGIFEFANANNMAVAITLPSAKYQDAPEELEAELTGFLESLYSGNFGEVPHSLRLEIGNEYYANFDGDDAVDQAEAYAEVVNLYADIIDDVESRFVIDPDQFEYGVQLGRSDEENETILETLSDTALLSTDFLIHHRFPLTQLGAGSKVDTVEAGMEDFNDAIEELGGEEAELYVSAYNSGSLTRGEAANAFLELETTEEGMTRDDLDLDGRSNIEFEDFYQEKLADRDYGLEQGDNILQIFSEYQGIGADAMATYGWDLIHAGRHSLQGSDGESYTFTGGAIQDMMAESLTGTEVLDWYEDNEVSNSKDETVSTYGFDSMDKLVVFLAAPSDPEQFEETMPVSVSLAELGELQGVWGESLTAETPENWHELFDIPEVDGVDQSNEANTFAVAERAPLELGISDGNLVFEFSEPGQIVRLSFARTDEGEEDIAKWQDGEAMSLELASDDDEDDDEIDFGDDLDEDDEDDAGGDDGGQNDDQDDGQDDAEDDFDLPILPDVPVTEEDAPEEPEPDVIDDDSGSGFEGLLLALLLLPLLAAFGG